MRTPLLALLLAAPHKTVTLSLRCEPAAHVRALWVGGKGSCDTPCRLAVPLRAHVQLEFSAPGHLSSTQAVFATEDKTVDAELPVHAPF